MPTFPLTFASIQFFACVRILGAAVPLCLETTCAGLYFDVPTVSQNSDKSILVIILMVISLPIQNKIYFNHLYI